MGGYAEAVRAAFPGAVSEPALPGDCGWVLVTTGDLPPDEARRLFPSPRELLVLSPATQRDDARGVRYGRVHPGPPPSIAEDATRRLSEGFGAAVLLDGLDVASGRILLGLARRGVSRVAWRNGVGWRVGATRRMALLKPWTRLEQSVARWPLLSWYRRRIERGRAHHALRQRNTQAFHGERCWVEQLSRSPVRRERPADDGVLDVVLYIGQLNSGGAERQLCNLAVGLRRRGHRVRVLTTYPLADENAHYLGVLRQAGVSTEVAGQRPRPEAVAALRALDIDPEAIGFLPEVIRHPVLDLAGELLPEPPHVLHCWLDYPNLIGAAATALVGAPRVVLSTRNLNPTHFPAFYKPWMDEWYGFLAALPSVHLVANSNQGAADYARWLGVACSRFDVIPNGVDLSSRGRPTERDVARIRSELKLAPRQPLVAGVFRLAEEKQPLVFLDVVARVRSAVPDLRVALVGIGDMETVVRRRIRDRGLGTTVTMLGQRKDIAAILGAADVTLLTSLVEGTPNVLLESQSVGTPAVATAVGGTPDALEDGVTGRLERPDDPARLAGAVLRLLRDAALRERMGRAGRVAVEERFSMGRMVDRTLGYYERLMDSADPSVVVANGADLVTSP